MRIHKKFSTFEEYEAYVKDFLHNLRNPVLYSDKELEILQPFFDDRYNTADPKVAAGLDYYVDFLDKNQDHIEFCNSIAETFSYEEVAEVLGFRVIEPDDDESDDYELEYNMDVTFPMVACITLSASFDRMGDMKIACSDFVSLVEFSEG